MFFKEDILMIKTTTFYRNIEDPDSFQAFYDSIFPEIHQLPGIIETKVTRIYDENEDGIQLILDTLFESEAAMQRVLATPKASELMKMVNDSSVADFYWFIAQEQYTDLKQMRQMEDRNR
jgi:heme-degrading monooxygenase HmoA